MGNKKNQIVPKKARVYFGTEKPVNATEGLGRRKRGRDIKYRGYVEKGESGGVDVSLVRRLKFKFITELKTTKKALDGSGGGC